MGISLPIAGPGGTRTALNYVPIASLGGGGGRATEMSRDDVRNLLLWTLGNCCECNKCGKRENLIYTDEFVAEILMLRLVFL